MISTRLLNVTDVKQLSVKQTQPHLCDNNNYFKIQHITRYTYTGGSQLCLMRFGSGLFYPDSPGLFHWHWGNRMIVPVSVMQLWRIWASGLHKSINKFRFKHNKQSKTKSCVCFRGDAIHWCHNYLYVLDGYQRFSIEVHIYTYIKTW